MTYGDMNSGYTTGYGTKQEVSVSAGTAFKIGFFGAFGAMVASLIIWLVVFIVVLILGASLGDVFTNLN